MKTVSKNKSQFFAKSQSGFNLIEVMVASFLLSFAVLGVAGLQVLGSKSTHQSLMKHQAMGLVQNLTERIRANQEALSAYEFNSDTDVDCSVPASDCSGQNCSAIQIAELDKHNLVCGYGSLSKTAALKASTSNDSLILANGSLKVECIPVGNCASRDIRITVGWTERNLGNETVELQEETQKSDSFVLTTRIARP